MRRRSLFRGRLHSSDVQASSAKSGERAWPGLKAAKPIVNFLRGAAEINPAVFSLKDWCQHGLRTVLLARFNRAGLKCPQGLDHQIGAHRRQLRRQRFGGVVFRNRELSLQKDVASIEAFGNPHGRHAGNPLAIRNCPLDWRRAAIFWQPLSVQSYFAEFLKLQQPGWYYAAIADY